MKQLKRKYTKQNCNYWGHVFVPLGVSNRLDNGSRIRFCSRCEKHFTIKAKGLLTEEIQDLITTTLQDLPDIKIRSGDFTACMFSNLRMKKHETN